MQVHMMCLPSASRWTPRRSQGVECVEWTAWQPLQAVRLTKASRRWILSRRLGG